MNILKDIFGKKDTKIHVDEIAMGKDKLLSSAVIVEKGENVNGSWIKFGDGTIICRHTITVPGTNTARGALFSSAMQKWRFPVDFSSAPFFDGTVRAGASGVFFASGDDGAGITYGSFRLLNALNTSSNINIELFAIGK